MEQTQSSLGKFLDPHAILAQLNVAPGNTIVDFGCGPGFFSLPFAQAVGENGKVFALDILPQALEAVSSKAKNSGILNIVTKRVNFEKTGGSKIEDNWVDWVIMKDVLFQNKEKETIIIEAQRILRQGGKVVVVEWNQEKEEIGPDMNLRIAKIELKELFEKNGFDIEKDIATGDFHYGFVAIKR